MFEVWAKLERFSMYAPIAWFENEADALDYARSLEGKGRPAEVHYNETAVFSDYDAPTEWARAR